MDIFQDELNCILEKNPTVHHFFEQAVEETPDRIAVETDGECITYSELNNKANCLAHTLLVKGLKLEQVVAVQLVRSIDMVITILAILKAGGAYLPIEVCAPRERVEYILEDSGASMLLHQNKEDINYPNVLCVNISTAFTEKKIENLEIPMNSNQLAYVIYTSGSTGKPKGVMIEHSSIINRILWMKQAYHISKDSIILQKTPYTFDVSVWELFLWFFAGARLILLPHGEESNLQCIQHYISRYNITDCHFIPSLLDSFLKLLSGNATNIKSLRNVYCSGEVLHYATVKRFISSLYTCYGTRLHNLYGPTETAVDVTSFECTNYNFTQEIVPIGKAIANTELYIMTPDGRICGDDVPGELFIAGANVGRGYINQSELTRERFVEDIKVPGKKMFKTGDLAKWQGDLIIFLGRMDNQIKIRGMRVEPEEVEKAIMQVGCINRSVVCGVRNKENTSETLLAAVFESSMHIDSVLLRKQLELILPSYMIPSIFVQVQKLPLLNNGKVDRVAVKIELDNMRNKRSSELTYSAEDKEELVLSVIRSVVHPLVASNLSLDRRLDDAGIDSMTYLSIVVALEEFYNIHFDVKMLAYAVQTDIKTLVNYVINKCDK